MKNTAVVNTNNRQLSQAGRRIAKREQNLNWEEKQLQRERPPRHDRAARKMK
jgi:hypothetical protein